MKKLPILMMCMLMATAIYAENPLTNEEISTVQKMRNTGIFSKERTTEEWREPIRTIDAASAVTKAAGKLKTYTDETKQDLIMDMDLICETTTYNCFFFSYIVYLRIEDDYFYPGKARFKYPCNLN